MDTTSDAKERMMTKAIDIWMRLRRFFGDLGAELARTAPRLSNALREAGH